MTVPLPVPPRSVAPTETGLVRGHGKRGIAAHAALAAGLFLAACSAQPDTPGGVTADEARQLNDAAAMLDANSVDANAVTQNESDL